jgi:hypothetical protein
MKTATKVSLYVLGLTVVFSGAWAAGALAGPITVTEPPAEHQMDGHDETVDTRLPGLASADNGFRLDLAQTTRTAGTEPFTFRILGPGDVPVTGFDVEHEKQLHFIVVRRDSSGFQHLHPHMATDGTWSVPLTLPDAGSYRVFADFKPTGQAKTVLGADVQVPGPYQPVQFDNDLRASTVDGYEVRLDGLLTAGKSAAVTATVTRDGKPVTDLQPYLGAYGHLVALRSADLGYLHVHPLETTTAGPQVRFAVEVPTSGRYRLFLDFQHNGQVRTAEFTVTAS